MHLAGLDLCCNSALVLGVTKPDTVLCFTSITVFLCQAQFLSSESNIADLTQVITSVGGMGAELVKVFKWDSFSSEKKRMLWKSNFSRKSHLSEMFGFQVFKEGSPAQRTNKLYSVNEKVSLVADYG